MTAYSEASGESANWTLQPPSTPRARMIASRWVCPACGAIQHGTLPDRCDDCGADGNSLERELEPRREITSRQ